MCAATSPSAAVRPSSSAVSLFAAGTGIGSATERLPVQLPPHQPFSNAACAPASRSEQPVRRFLPAALRRRRLGDCELRFGSQRPSCAGRASAQQAQAPQRAHCQQSAALRRSAARPSASCPARRRPRRLRQPHRRGHGGDGDGVRLRAVPRRRLVPVLQRLALPRLRAQALRSRRFRRPRRDRHPHGVHVRDRRAGGDDACGPGARPPTSASRGLGFFSRLPRPRLRRPLQALRDRSRLRRR